jgi:hypothetical protein
MDITQAPNIDVEEDPYPIPRYTIEEFLDAVDSGYFIDYDGHGYAVIDGLARREFVVSPSTARQDIPAAATHVEWYNR